MKCPHCGEGVFIEWSAEVTYTDPSFDETSLVRQVSHSDCPQCGEMIVILESGEGEQEASQYGVITSLTDEYPEREILYPRSTLRPLPPEVPSEYSDEFAEACDVLSVSPKSSAALSRRVLQRLLRDHFKIKKRNLAEEIQEFIETQGLPSFLAEAVDAIRNVGNFAAHPSKSKHSGEVVDVEPGEAKWTLDVLESLFDFAFVQPMRLKRQRESLNSKLASMGKPPMKGKG